MNFQLLELSFWSKIPAMSSFKVQAHNYKPFLEIVKLQNVFIYSSSEHTSWSDIIWIFSGFFCMKKEKQNKTADILEHGITKKWGQNKVCKCASFQIKSLNSVCYHDLKMKRILQWMAAALAMCSLQRIEFSLCCLFMSNDLWALTIKSNPNLVEMT